MFMRRASLFLMSMMAISQAHAANLRAADVITFDVAGVKTGMDYDEAVKAMTEHFHVPASSLDVDKYPALNVVTGDKQPQYIAYEKTASNCLYILKAVFLQIRNMRWLCLRFLTSSHTPLRIKIPWPKPPLKNMVSSQMHLIHQWFGVKRPEKWQPWHAARILSSRY